MCLPLMSINFAHANDVLCCRRCQDDKISFKDEPRGGAGGGGGGVGGRGGALMNMMDMQMPDQIFDTDDEDSNADFDAATTSGLADDAVRCRVNSADANFLQ